MLLNKIRAKREHKHKHNTNSPQGVEAQAKTQEEYCRTDRSIVKSGRAKQSSVGGIKLRHQPRHKDHPAYRNLERGRQGQRHLCLSLDASGAGCRDYKSGRRQSPGSARRGRYVNPASWDSKRPKQEGTNIRPGEG